MYLMFKGKLFSSEPAPEEQRGGEEAVAAGRGADPREAAAMLPQLFSSLCRPRSDFHSWTVP